jgi:hypothetical protein
MPTNASPLTHTACTSWTSSSLREQILATNIADGHALLRLLTAAKINIDIAITGSIVERTLRDPRAQGEAHFSYTECFNKGPLPSPGVYLVRVYEALKQSPHHRVVYPGFLARGLVAFPSFLREYQLLEALPNILAKHYPNDPIKLEASTTLDQKGKCDVLIHAGAQTFHLWSFVASEKGYGNLCSKLSGERGALGMGLHILMPIFLAFAPHHLSWIFHSEDSISEALSTAAKPYPYIQIRRWAMGGEAINFYHPLSFLKSYT